jgi:hypothetical protein
MPDPARPLRIAILARSVYPLHGLGGLERHVYDLIRHLIARDVYVTLITKPPASEFLRAEAAEGSRDQDSESLRSGEGPGGDSPPPNSSPPRSRGGAGEGTSTAIAAALGVPESLLRFIAVP